MKEFDEDKDKSSMSNSNRQNRVIWRKAQSDDASSSTLSTPSIRPSNSFMEKLLRDCLRPRRITDEAIPLRDEMDSNQRPYEDYKRSTDWDDATSTARGIESRHLRDGAKQAPIFRGGGIEIQHRYANAAAARTPMRGSDESSTHKQPRVYGVGARTPPHHTGKGFRARKFQRITGIDESTPTHGAKGYHPGAFRTRSENTKASGVTDVRPRRSTRGIPTRIVSDFQPRDFRKTTGTPTLSVTDFPPRVVTDVPPRDRRSTRSIPTRIVSDFQPRDFRKTKSTPTRSVKDFQHREFRNIASSKTSTPTISVTGIQSREFLRIIDGASITPARSVADIPPRNFRRSASWTRSTPTRGIINTPPRDFRSSIDDANITSTLSLPDFQPRDSKRATSNSKSTPTRRFTDFRPRDFERTTSSAKSTPTRSVTDFKPRDFKDTNPDFTYRPSEKDFRAVSEPIAPRTGRDRNSSSKSSSHPLSVLSFQEEREQALRDYKVTIEYKHLKSHAPGGVYLIPSMDSLRDFFGIIFVRRGPFTNGIFKFRLSLPPKYNDNNMWPSIIFSSRVYNPYVNEKTGQLDVQSAYPSWDPSRHYLVTVLTYLKKIFYSKNFSDAKANVKAKELAEKDPQAYKKNVEACVHESQKKVYVNEKGSTAKFTEEEVAHRVLRDLLKHHIRSDNQVTKQIILSQVEKARKV